MPKPSHPFDAAAPAYDLNFTHTWSGRELRGLVWRSLEPLFGSGDRVLELGCGTGEDAVWLARRGVEVVATDISPAMLEETRRKARAAGVDGLIETRLLDLADIGEEAGGPEGPFDGALSNFGPLNCVPSRSLIARSLATLVRPGGVVVAVVMGRYCAWEIAWHLLHGRPGMAFRRLRSGAPARVAPGAEVAVWYPTPGRLRREFAGPFRERDLLAMGCLLPPPYLAHLVAGHPRLRRRLAAVEERWRRLFPLPWLADHFLMSFERPS